MQKGSIPLWWAGDGISRFLKLEIESGFHISGNCLRQAKSKVAVISHSNNKQLVKENFFFLT
jgi:hypothetical protein